MTQVQIDVDLLYRQHDELLRVQEQLEDLLQEATDGDRRIAETLSRMADELVDHIENVLDSDRSRVVMEDVRAHGAIPWTEVEAELDHG